MIIVEMWAWFAWCAATLFHEEKKRKKKKEGKKRRNNFKKASFLCILHRVWRGGEQDIKGIATPMSAGGVDMPRCPQLGYNAAFFFKLN